MRRVGAVAALFLIGLLAGPGAAAAQDVFEFVEIADGIYGSYVLPPTSPSQFSASLVVVNTDHVVVVDGRHSPSAAEALIEEIRGVTDLPVRYLINSHWHSDHIQGNQAFREAYPGLRIVGHPTTAESILSRGPEQLADEVSRNRERIETWRRWLALGETDDGRVLSKDDSAQVREAVELRGQYVDDLETVLHDPPDLLVSDSVVWEDGGRTVKVFHPGPAHTMGDLVVEVWPEGVLAVGDLIEDGLPYLEHGTVRGAATVLDALARRKFDFLFGAHARRLDDASLLQAQAALFSDLTEQVTALHTDGVSVEETVSRVDVGGHREGFTASVDVTSERFAEFVEGVVRQLYDELSEEARNPPERFRVSIGPLQQVASHSD